MMRSSPACGRLAAFGAERGCSLLSRHAPSPDQALRRRGVARGSARLDGPSGFGRRERRGRPAATPTSPAWSRSGQGARRRRLALLGDQGPARGAAGADRGRAFRRHRRIGPCRLWLERDGRRGRAAPDRRVPGLALFEARTRPPISTSPGGRSRTCQRRCGASSRAGAGAPGRCARSLSAPAGSATPPTIAPQKTAWSPRSTASPAMRHA